MSKKILISIIILLLLTTVINIKTTYAKTNLKSSGKYNFIINVDDDGEIEVKINYHSDLNEGSSWVLVPKNFTSWTLKILKGEIESSKLKDAYTTTGEKYVFYSNFTYNYTGANGFEMQITYQMDYGSIIVEPQCFFFSPQIGFSTFDSGIVHIFFPKSAELDMNKMQPKPEGIQEKPNAYVATFYLQNNIARIAIEYTTTNQPNITRVESGIFTVETPTRYLDLAERLLKAYDKVYYKLTEIFAVNLTEVKVKFYAPTMEDLWIGGYIPFNGTYLGEINLNLFYVRTSLGYWEQIAIHELVHHFVWAAGITPNLLWFHEGLAEYISFTLTLRAGWTGAEVNRERLEKLAELLKPNLGFIQDWKPGKAYGNIIMYYAASYEVVKEIAESHGGIQFYSKFFRQIRNLHNLTSTDVLIYYLSKCANEDLTPKFIQWHFNVVNVCAVHEAIKEGKTITNRQLPIAQPWLTIARKLLEQAEEALDRGDLREAIMKALMGGFIAKTSLTLTLLTAIGVTLIIMRRITREEI